MCSSPSVPGQAPSHPPMAGTRRCDDHRMTPLRTEDPALLRGEARYVDDLARAQLCVAFVRSPIAHGRIESIDGEAARAAPGVVAVLTAADLGITAVPPHPMLPDVFSRPPLAHDV